MKNEVMTKAKPSDETFVRIWAHGSKSGWTLHEVAKRLNLSYAHCYHYARKLAHAGVELPLLNGQRHRTSGQINKLNAIVASVITGKDK